MMRGLILALCLWFVGPAFADGVASPNNPPWLGINGAAVTYPGVASVTCTPGSQTYSTAQSGTALTIPAGCTVLNAVYAIGEGGDGAAAVTTTDNGAGGGSGSFAGSINLTSPATSSLSGTVTVFIGGGGTNLKTCIEYGAGASCATTTCNGSISGATNAIIADCGTSASGITRGVAGATADSVGTTKFAGNVGGSGAAGNHGGASGAGAATEFSAGIASINQSGGSGGAGGA